MGSSFEVMLPRKISLLPTGNEEREVLGVGNIPVSILPFCQDMKTIALYSRGGDSGPSWTGCVKTVF